MSDETKKLRLALISRLRAEGAEELIGPMVDCGSELGMVCTCCGETKTCEIRCKRRWCPECQPMISAQRMDRWGHAIGLLQWPLFLTLTMPNSLDADSIRKLKDAWGRLRRRKLMTQKIRGGVATFEITNKGNGWHPHIHAVADCRWLSLHVPEPLRSDSAELVAEKCRLAQLEMSGLWAQVLKVPTAFVWIRRVKQVESMAAEIMKYCMKGSDLVESPDPIAPLLRVLKGTRLLAGWGSLHPLPSPDEEEGVAVQCSNCQAEKSFLPEDVISYITRRTETGSYQQPASSNRK